MNKEKDEDVIAYVGFDDMGNILGAVVHEDSNRERTAVWIAAWILDGLHVKRTTVADVRLNFGRDFEGPDLPPTAPYHVRVLTRNEKGQIYAECEGDEKLLEKYERRSRHSSYRDEDESHEESKRREERAEQAKAYDILEALCKGRGSWRQLRTLGDYDTLRRQIAGVIS